MSSRQPQIQYIKTDNTDYTKQSSTLFIETDITGTGTEHRLNVAHIRRDGYGRLHLPAIKNEFKIQCPEFVGDPVAFENRFNQTFNGVWLDDVYGTALRRFFRKEVELLGERLAAPRRAAAYRALQAQQNEKTKVKAYMNPDYLGLPLETGITSDEPFNVCWSPTQLLVYMNDRINDRSTSPAQRSELESNRFMLIQRLNGVHKVWLRNGIDPTEQDEG
ncbi:hypothetical protein OLL83_001065 [Shewanella algae]|uniref:hypothetical protein n=1 Tax=Shewanella algae TaxID=38313 RepID=UPI0022312A78|nr:hypothetical protein [Shewanella algae]UZD59529.1 hypothetical protein OLL83_001065 [Shewanella algae]